MKFLLQYSTLLTILFLTACGEDDTTSESIVNENQAADPLVIDTPIAFIRRVLVSPDGTPRTLTIDARNMNVFEPGAALILKDRAIASAPETNITDRAFTNDRGDVSLYDIRDLESDFSGQRLVFSMRGPFDPDPDDQPSWNIWVYNLATDQLERVIGSDTTAEAGQDRDPHFLPDGRIVFTSDRQRQSRAILLDEGRPQFSALDEDRQSPAFVLHTMSDTGTDITQISFNQSHDQDPTVASSGHIIFNRWDNIPGRNVISLYKSNPDGSQLERLYGYHSQDSGRDGSDVLFLEPREMSDGRLLVLANNQAGGDIGGDLLLLDVENYVETSQPTFANKGLLSEGQESPIDEIVTLSLPSQRGRFASAYPLYDGSNRLLITWSQCRLSEAGNIVPCTDLRLNDDVNPPIEAAPLYGLWILNLNDDTQQPVAPPIEGVAYTEAVVLANRTLPFVHQPDPTAINSTQDLINEAAGILHIRSIYDFTGTDRAVPNFSTASNPSLTSAAERGSFFLRLVKPVSLPDNDVVNLPGTAFGRSSNELMREILGYGTIHPDGSVYMKVPANVPFSLSIVDANGRRTSSRHKNWLQLRPGEVMQCNGCHEQNDTSPHGRTDAESPSINSGAPFPGLDENFVIEEGDTMAEALGREIGAAPEPNFDLSFTDIWTNPNNRTKDPSFLSSYRDLKTLAPINIGCATRWLASCRATIHYEKHIHPLWALERQLFEADDTTPAANNTCTNCHSRIDEFGLARVPDGQLELSDGPSSDQPDHFNSYRELLFNDAELELLDESLVDRLVPILDSNGNLTFELDDDGNVILDIAGNPIPRTTIVRVNASMSPNGALSSDRFLGRFGSGASHQNYLTSAELKLISEWLDIGAQYYNDPFEVPQ